jgi:hypothetical protein
MRILSLLLLCFMLCGCRTFTAIQIDSLQQQYFYAGYDVGHKKGSIWGKIGGNIECMAVSDSECSTYFAKNLTELENLRNEK